MNKKLLLLIACISCMSLCLIQAADDDFVRIPTREQFENQFMNVVLNEKRSNTENIKLQNIALKLSIVSAVFSLAYKGLSIFTAGWESETDKTIKSLVLTGKSQEIQLNQLTLEERCAKVNFQKKIQELISQQQHSILDTTDIIKKLDAKKVSGSQLTEAEKTQYENCRMIVSVLNAQIQRGATAAMPASAAA